jgi:hypothetical protein
MPTFNVIFTEIKERAANIAVEVEAASVEEAAEKAQTAYERGQYDVALEEAVADTRRCDISVGYYEGETFVKVF